MGITSSIQLENFYTKVISPSKTREIDHSSLPEDTILGKPNKEDIKSHYNLGAELGRGKYGVIHRCKDITTGQEYACKSITKSGLDKECIRREVQIMQRLSGNPNVVEFIGSYEDDDSVHIVMELCTGGDLCERTIARKSYSEKEAVVIFKKILYAVNTCHGMGVVHRDLKPDNFLYSDESEDAELKITDFGLSIFFEEGEIYNELMGSHGYFAPEVLRRNYGKEADIWSTGVILYILLSGTQPFWGDTSPKMIAEVLTGYVEFGNEPWQSISDSAKDLILRILTFDPNRRLTIAQILEHPWMKGASDEPVDQKTLAAMKGLIALNTLKRRALKTISENLTVEEVQRLKAIFVGMDLDNSGTILYGDFKTGFGKLEATKFSRRDVIYMMNSVDMKGDGLIDYIEFITATMDNYRFNERIILKD